MTMRRERSAAVAQIALGVTTTAMMIAALLWSVWDNWRSVVAEAGRTATHLAASAAIDADAALGGAAALAQQLGRRVAEDRSLLRPRDQRLAAVIADLAAAAPPGLAIRLADAEGNLLAASAGDDLAGREVSIAQDPAFRFHRRPAESDGNGVRISRPVQLVTRPVRAVSVSVAVREADGALLAIAFVSVPVGHLLPRVEETRRAGASRLAIVHVDGFALALSPQDGDADAMRIDPALAAATLATTGAVVDASPITGHEALVSRERLAHFPAVAIVSHDLAALRSAWALERMRLHLVMAACAAAAVALNVWLLLAVRGRVAVEARLRETSERRFRAFAEIASDWFWETDAAHRFTFVSSGVSSHGVPPESFIGYTRGERARMMPGGAVSARLAELEAAMERHEPIDRFVIDTVLPDGSRSWYEIDGVPILDDGGRFQGYRGIARDVTALREAQERAVESEARLVDSINTMPIGYALWNARDRLVTWNRRYVEQWPSSGPILRPGITFAAFIDKATRAAWPDLSEDEIRARIGERIARHGACNGSWMRDHPDGRIIELNEVRTSEGGVVSLYIDVTEHQRTLRRLAQSEARFRDGIERMGQGFVLWGPDEKLVAWNSRVVELLPHAAHLFVPGMDRATFLGNAARALLPDKDEAELQDMVRRRLDWQQRGESFEIQSGGRVIIATSHRTSDGGVVVTYNDVTAQRAIEAALRESESRFRDGIESMAQGFALWDSSHRLVAWNSRLTKMLPHVSDLMVVGMHLDTLRLAAAKALHGDLTDVETTAMLRRRAEADARGEPFEIRTRDGRFVVATPHPTSDGGIVVTYNDETDRRLAEVALRESEARFRDGIESMADGFTLWDAEDRLVAWNGRFMAVAPIEAEVLEPGIRFEDCIAHLENALASRNPDWDWRDYLARRRARRATLGKPIEVTNIHGTSLEIIEQATADGGVVSIYRDVTEARRAAWRLAESEARFHDFADAASDWFWETGPDHRFTFVSGGVRRVGVEPAELIGRTRAEYDALKGREVLPGHKELQEIIERRDQIRGVCFHEPASNGVAGRKIEIYGKPIFDDGGAFVGYRGTGRDVTARDRQQAELERALGAEREMNAQQRRFVSIASHEFRTPLAVIDGATQRLVARLPEADEEVRKRLERIRGAVSRMTELIDRTLSSARLDDGRIELHAARLDLSALLRDVIDRQAQISPQHEIALDVAPGDMAIEGDAKLLEQIFANLVSNAVKYSGRSRRVEVTLDPTPGGVRVAVRDRGVGIPANEVPQLFTRFFRASTAMGIPGTGIGLHLVRELVLMHGGAVAVASDVGVGTTFTVTLPSRQATRAADAAA